MRLTIQLDDEQAEWVENRASERDRSKAKVIRQCIEAVKNGEQGTVNHGESPCAVSRREFDALRERVDALEAGDVERTENRGRAADVSASDPPGSGGQDPAAEWEGVVLAEVDSPAIRNDPESFMDAIAAAVELLEDGPRTKSEFVDELADAHPVGYENTNTWWRRVGRPGLKAHPGVQSPPAGASKWRLRD